MTETPPPSGPPEAAERRIDRLRKRADFKLVSRQSRRFPAKFFVLLRRRRKDGDPSVRIGYTITKKIGGAVVRNRIRRRFREAFRAQAAAIAELGCDYVMIARPGAEDAPWTRLLDDVEAALVRLTTNADIDDAAARNRRRPRKSKSEARKPDSGAKTQ